MISRRVPAAVLSLQQVLHYLTSPGTHAALFFLQPSVGGLTDDAKAAKAVALAIDNAGEGTLYFPGDGGSTYSTAPFNLSSDMHVEIESGATVLYCS